MKILWFANSPCGSIRRKGKNAILGGWLISLEDEIKHTPNIELEVAYFSEKKEGSFVYDGVRYYPMGESHSDNPVKRVLNRRQSVSDRDKIRLSWMMAVVKQSHPDLIHIHGTEQSFGLILNYVEDIPIVFSIQGLLAPYSEFYFRGLPKHDAFYLDSWYDRLKNVGIRDEWHYFFDRALRERQFLKKAKYIIGRTAWDKACTLAMNPQRKYFVVNEMMRREFYQKRWKGDFSDSKICIVSTISGGIYKGLEVALKAGSLLKEFSSVDFEWHVAGYSCSSKWVRMAEKVSGVKSNDANVIYHGRLKADDLCELLTKSDMYVHVSHIENSPNAVCEAMLVGMPVIASFAGGTASLLENGKEGALYQDGDSYALAGMILDFVQHPDKAKQYAVSARERALKRHDRDSVVRELLAAYDMVLSNP